MDKKYCKNCKKQLKNRQKVFCDNKCQSQYNHNNYIERWKKGLEDGLRGEYQLSSYIRTYILNKFDNKCSKCGWHEINQFTNKVPLEIDHKDGNYLNNSEDNLELLCPNCHSLTSTYKALNYGHGRKGRNKYL